MSKRRYSQRLQAKRVARDGALPEDVDASRGLVLVRTAITECDGTRWESVDLFTNAQWRRFKHYTRGGRPVPYRENGVNRAIAWHSTYEEIIKDPARIAVARARVPITNRILDALPPGYFDASAP